LADRAAEFPAVYKAAEEARLAAILHDLGKCGDLFQRQLFSKEHRIDHSGWSLEAWEALMSCPGFFVIMSPGTQKNIKEKFGSREI